MAAYYNETDPFAAAWLRELIKVGQIAPGEVDTRSIEDVVPTDLAGFTQCHFFAGIAGWSYALRLAGWSDDRPVWTGSCPCQPFSAAGQGKGFADERHLWPAFFHLISQCLPLTIFGEQVASKDGLAWLDLVQADLEGADYSCGAVDTCAAGFGAPHIRQRLYWVAESQRERERRITANRSGEKAAAQGRREENARPHEVGNGSTAYRMDDSEHGRRKAWIKERQGANPALPSGEACGLDNRERLGPVNGFWRNADWLFCRDERWRAVESGTCPLVNGAAARVGRLRGYGNAINAIQAKEFIRCFMDYCESATGWPVFLSPPLIVPGMEDGQ